MAAHATEMAWLLTHPPVSSRRTRTCACVGASMDQRIGVKSFACSSSAVPKGPSAKTTESGFLLAHGGLVGCMTITPRPFVPEATPDEIHGAWDTESYAASIAPEYASEARPTTTEKLWR